MNIPDTTPALEIMYQYALRPKKAKPQKKKKKKLFIHVQRGVRASYSSVQGGVGAIHCSVFIRFQREVRAYLLGAIQYSVLIPAQREIRAKYSSVLSDVDCRG